MGRDSMLSKHGCELTDRIFQGWAHDKAMKTPMEPSLVGIPPILPTFFFRNRQEVTEYTTSRSVECPNRS